jgi:hypothetical protein
LRSIGFQLQQGYGPRWRRCVQVHIKVYDGAVELAGILPDFALVNLRSTESV